MNQSSKGQLAIVACALFWSTAGLFIKLIDWHPMVISGVRSLIAALFLLGLSRLQGRRSKIKAPPLALWGAGITYAATMILFVWANKLVGSANAILIQYTAPIWAAIFGWMLAKEKPFTEHWIALAAVFLGLLIFFWEGLNSGGPLFGMLIALLSGITFGIQSVFLRMMNGAEPRDALILSHWLTAIFCLPFAFIAPPSLTAPNILGILFMGFIQIGIASALFSYGIKRVRAVQAMLTAVAEPLLNPVWVLVITGERPALTTIIGGGIILAAVLASSLVGTQREVVRSR
jgi:drug/metabolite transporter (DMT)-like permease